MLVDYDYGEDQLFIVEPQEKLNLLSYEFSDCSKDCICYYNDDGRMVGIQLGRVSYLEVEWVLSVLREELPPKFVDVVDRWYDLQAAVKTSVEEKASI